MCTEKALPVLVIAYSSTMLPLHSSPNMGTGTLGSRIYCPTTQQALRQDVWADATALCLDQVKNGAVALYNHKHCSWGREGSCQAPDLAHGPQSGEDQSMV